MEAHIVDWLSLIIRWIHLIVGIAWIGSSFYFNWLESHLNREGSHPPQIAGDLWSVHGGGFYHSMKYKVAPDELPTILHWFKWEAYTTWISGFSLLVIVYFWNAQVYMIDPSIMSLEPWQAIGVCLGTMLFGWIFYDQLCKSKLGEYPQVMLLIGLVVLALVSYGLAHVLSGRAMYITIGSTVGSMMVANVFFVIIPNQKITVQAMIDRQVPDPTYGKKALQRSRHNNYLTLPVLFMMISNHYPATFGHQYNWLILVALSIISVGVRHYFNVKHKGKHQVWILPTAGVATVVLMVLTSPMMKKGETNEMAVSDATMYQIVQTRCSSCHALEPTQAGFATAPKGVMLETMEQIQIHAESIYVQSVATRAMPLANITQITDQERNMMGAWIQAHRKKQ